MASCPLKTSLDSTKTMKTLITLAALIMFPLFVHAGVNPKNGNFYISYTDAEVKNGSHSLEITRTYNSKATKTGWFGYGWGSKYETHLLVLPDGSVLVRENGSGLNTFYRGADQTALKPGIERIVSAAVARDNLNPGAAEKLFGELLKNEELRVSKVIELGLHTDLPMGATLSNNCGNATLIRVADGYKRKDCNIFGQTETATDLFDLQGRLIQHATDDGYVVKLVFEKDVHNKIEANTAKIIDTSGSEISLTFNADGRVTQLSSPLSSQKYTYDDAQNLVAAEQSTGNKYDYFYDNQHNLTRINYLDNTSMFISYSPKMNGFGGVDAVTERNGARETFVYRTDPVNENHFWTRHTKFSNDGEVTSKEYEFENQLSSTGIEHLASRSISAGHSRNATKFDSQGRTTRKTNSSGIDVEYIYHPRTGKLILSFNQGMRTEFHYDPVGNLIMAKNDEGQQIEINYKSSTLIQSIREINTDEKTRHDLQFVYNKNGKPEEVSMTGVGKIVVKYDEAGEIVSVKSKQGPKMALRVAQVFQRLLDVVQVSKGNF